MIAELTAKETGVIGGAGEVSVVAHRVVHGGEKFTEGTLITDEVLAQIEALNPLAPLHNPVNVAGIREMRRLFPAVPHVAVFDTAFHHTLPAYAYLYGLPYELYEKKGVRRYGFHGTSHHYVSLRAAQFLKRRPNELRLVSCHLGNGSSLCAVDHGRSVDTTMGFTPAEGLIMGTRCGDVDAGVLAFLERTEGLTATQSEEMLNKKSGLLGLSGVSSDMREVLKAADEGKHRALLALKAYCYRVRKYIGAYVASMGGLDAVIFTGGIGQGSAEVRALALQGLECMGIELDAQRNRDARGFDEVCRISTDDSKVAVLVVPTDEERMMAREALRTLSRSYITRVLEAQKQQPFLVEVSAHHIHLTQEHVEALFGKGHQLTKHADLSQPGQYACKEQLTIVGPKGRIERVRVLGPTRKYTQIEIAMTEQFKLGVHPPIRESGDIADTPGCTLEGPTGSVTGGSRRHLRAAPHPHDARGRAPLRRARQVGRARAHRRRSRTGLRRRARARGPELRAGHAHRHGRSERRQRPDRRAGLHRGHPERGVKPFGGAEPRPQTCSCVLARRASRLGRNPGRLELLVTLVAVALAAAWGSHFTACTTPGRPMAGTIIITLDNVWSAGSSTMDIIAKRTREAFSPDCEQYVENLYDELELLQRISLWQANRGGVQLLLRRTKTALERFRDAGLPPGWPSESYPSMISIWTELLGQLEKDARFVPPHDPAKSG